jgi:hypothetical protein
MSVPSTPLVCPKIRAIQRRTCHYFGLVPPPWFLKIGHKKPPLHDARKRWPGGKALQAWRLRSSVRCSFAQVAPGRHERRYVSEESNLKLIARPSIVHARRAQSLAFSPISTTRRIAFARRELQSFQTNDGIEPGCSRIDCAVPKVPPF